MPIKLFLLVSLVMRIIIIFFKYNLQLSLHFQERRELDSEVGHTLYLLLEGGDYRTTYKIFILGAIPFYFLSHYN